LKPRKPQQSVVFLFGLEAHSPDSNGILFLILINLSIDNQSF